jgi:transcription initiation factor TFIIE subunit alpha
MHVFSKNRKRFNKGRTSSVGNGKDKNKAGFRNARINKSTPPYRVANNHASSNANKKKNNFRKIDNHRHLSNKHHHVYQDSAHKSVPVKQKADPEIAKKLRDEKKEEKYAVGIEYIEKIVATPRFSEFALFIGQNTNEIMKTLAMPKTDEYIAEKLNMKINDVRRVLNKLNSEGVVKYITNKNEKGWITFKWYIDKSKLEKIMATTESARLLELANLPIDCNDFFFCEKCFSKNNEVLPFDVVFEKKFRCGTCGSSYKRANREYAENLIKKVITTAR